VCLLSLASALLGCVAEEGEAEDLGDEEVFASSDAILGGQEEPGYPAVGLLLLPSGAIGSGVLISPTMVLTAAHVAGGKPRTFHFGTPPRGQAPSRENLRSVEVVETIVHPCYERKVGDRCPGAANDPVDVALVRLSTPVRDVRPMNVVDWPLDTFFGRLSPYRGSSCVAIGFGAHLDADGKPSFGTRRSARSRIDEVGAAELVAVRQTGIATGGDSGGPLVCLGRIVGTVRGSAVRVDPASPYERTREAYERADLHRTWIRQELRAAAR
jgi:hypothetical protein